MINTDAAWRYLPVIDYLNKKNLWPEEVLEVGSGTKGLAEYYDGKILGIDNAFDRTAGPKLANIRHKVGLITKLPVKDNSYPVVVCLDTYEHMPQKDRRPGLEELLRVTKPEGIIIIGFPTGEWSAKLERIIEKQFKKNYQYDHPWLTEHREFGLPKVELLEQWIKQSKVNSEIVDRIANVNLGIWWFYHWLFTVNIGRRWAKWLLRFNQQIMQFGRLPVPPYYRQILVIKKYGKKS